MTATTHTTLTQMGSGRRTLTSATTEAGRHAEAPQTTWGAFFALVFLFLPPNASISRALFARRLDARVRRFDESG